MTFHSSSPSGSYRALRLVSMEGRWELGLSDYSSGMRLRMGRMGKPPSVLDFCLGRDAALFGQVLAAVVARLEVLPEEASPSEIDALFPWAGTRPDMTVHLVPLLEPSPVIV